MCGIVGHIGGPNENTVDVILGGLTRLEYRGYDSAGICIKNHNNKFEIYKKIGKIDNLKNYLKEFTPKASIGIGHTRWATHGGVTDINAHPHGNEDVALIQNGIIENYVYLKEKLKLGGYNFVSETDTEVFLALVNNYYQKGKDLFNSVREAFVQLKGNFAFVVMDRSSEKIVAIKRGAPLVCGEKGGELFVSSDPYALMGQCDQLMFPEDEVLCLLERGQKIQFFELSGEVSTRVNVRKQSLNQDVSEKGNHEHFMVKEIFEQPEKIKNFLKYYYEGEGQALLKDAVQITPKKIHIAACGTANYAGLVIRNFLENTNRISTQVELASEFRYRNPIISKEDVGIFISQSGETADTLGALEVCSNLGMRTINIGNVEGSSQYRKCQHNLLIQAGVEIGVASTKAFTLMGLTGFLYSQSLLKKDGPSKKDSSYKEICLLVERIEDLLKRAPEIENMAQKLFNKKGFLFTGRGVYFPITLEGALKLKEIAYIHAEGYAGGELKHGPIALIDEDMVNVALLGPELVHKMESNVEEVKARRGTIVMVYPQNEKHLKNLGNFDFPLNFEGLPNLGPLYINIFCQLFSYYTAKFKGTDIDKPRNLAKSVTVE